MRSNLRNLWKSLLACGAAIGLASLPALASPVKPAKTNPDQLLYSFAGGASDGAYPVSGLIAGNSGNFYGTTEYGGTDNLGTVFELSSNGAETVLYNFAGGASDGALPAASLIADGSGNLYGTTINGGSGDCSDDGCGTIFEVTPGGVETVLYSFQGGADGLGPKGSLFMDSSGNLYGTTFAGGSGNCEGGCGVVFELIPAGNGSWTESVIYSFQGGSDGAAPGAGLIQDSSGNLYSTTTAGGPPVHCPQGCGTVFELSPGGNGGWNESILYAFRLRHHGGDGAYPATNLLMDANGNLFGTAPQGGTRDCGGGCGAVFELSPMHNGNWLESSPYKFTAGKHGAFPSGGLIADSSGLMYGVAAGAGADNCGIVFQLNTNNNLTKTVYSFSGAPHDSCQPYGTLVEDQSGNLYGMSLTGGSSNLGAIFTLKK